MKPRRRDTGALPRPPAMMPERMGIIGKTQGVSDRPRPARKKNSRLPASPLSRRLREIWPVSSAAAGVLPLAEAAAAPPAEALAAPDPGCSAGRVTLRRALCG